MRNRILGRSFAAAGTAAGLTLMLVLLAPGPAAASQRGSTVHDRVDYEYQVTEFEYDANVALTAAESPAPACVPGVTSAWSGPVSSSPPALPGLNLGDGSLHIGRNGSGGTARGTEEFQFDFGKDFDGQRAGHEVVTACDMGQPAGHTQTFCTDVATSDVVGHVGFDGGVGDKVKMRWSFEQANVAGSWVPNTFSCEETFIYRAEGNCQPKKLSLSTFTRKRFKLPFACVLSSTGPPAGSGYEVYLVGGIVSGFLKLRRTSRN